MTTRRFLAVLLTALGCGAPASRDLRPAPAPTPAGRPALRQPGPLSPRLASYRIDAALDGSAKRITATETLTWKHDGVAPVASVPLHLYMNAFKNETSLFLRESRGKMRRAKMTDGKWGWIDVTSIRRAGDPAELRSNARYGVDETTLEVPLATPVAPGETLELTLTFTVQLPEVFARTGFKGDFLMVGQWFPKIGVLRVEQGVQRWHCEPFHLHSEFFADFGVYDVTLEVPDTHVIAATGVLVAVEEPGPGRRRLTYHAEDVHDFAWMADPFMQVTAGKADGDVDAFVYHRPEQAAFAPRHLEAAQRTIETFGRFVRYPWAAMTVIDPPPDAVDGAGGMEYPTLVTTAGDAPFARPGLWEPEFVTVHEVGHNWFQGILASNEVDEAWLDEGLNQYANGIVMDAWKGPTRSLIDWHGLHIGYYAANRVFGDLSHVATPITTRSYEFPEPREYGAATYAKTAVALKTLEEQVGSERFWKALGVYARAHAFRHPTAEDLFGTLERELGPEVRPFLTAAFHETGIPDYRVRDVRVAKVHEPRGVFGDGDERRTVGEDEAPDGEEWRSEVLLMNEGAVDAPVEVELVFADGTVERERWDGRVGGRWITRLGPSPLAEVVIDPDGDVPLEQEIVENGYRRRARTGSAWRAAARAGFWEQTLLQVVGL